MKKAAKLINAKYKSPLSILLFAILPMVNVSQKIYGLLFFFISYIAFIILCMPLQGTEL